MDEMLIIELIKLHFETTFPWGYSTIKEWSELHHQKGIGCQLTRCENTPNGNIDRVNIGSGNDLLLDGTNPLAEPMWFLFSEVLRHSPENNFEESALTIIPWNGFENHIFEITTMIQYKDVV